MATADFDDAPSSGDRDSLCDTITGFDPDLDDFVMSALDDVGRALERRGAALDELKKSSDRPPPPTSPPAAAAVPAAA